MTETTPLWDGFSITASDLERAQCECCAGVTVSVSGDIYSGEDFIGIYQVRWTERRPDHQALFKICFGSWGENSEPTDRRLAAATYYIDVDRGGAFYVRDDAADFLPSAGQISVALARDDIVGTPFAPTFFAILDAIFMKDERLDEVRNWRTPKR